MALTKQGPFQKLSHPHVLFGSSGFCGKSYGIRTAAVHILGTLREQGYPGLSHTIFCENYPELRDRMVPGMIEEFHDTIAEGEYHEKDSIYGMCFEFNDRSLGRILLRNIDTGQLGKRRGTESPGGIQVDELTQLMRPAWEHMRYGLRGSCMVDGRRVAVPPPPFGAGTNPDGKGCGWVRRLWVPEYQDSADELFDLVPRENFLLIRSRPSDNPTYNKSVESFLKGFSDPMLVKSRWEGSWDILGGVRFGQFNRKVHGFTWNKFWTYYSLPKDLSLDKFLEKCNDYGFKLYASLDYGTAMESASAFYLHLVDENGKIWTFGELWMQGKLLGSQAKLIHSRIDGLPVSIIYCDPALRGRANTDEQRGISRIDKFRLHGIPMKEGINDRVEGWATMDSLLEYEASDGVITREPLWRICDEPVSYEIKGGCVHLIEQIQDAPRRDTDLEDVDPMGGIWHGLDSCFAPETLVLTERGEVPIEDVQVGEKVLTRLGWKAVLNSWQSGKDIPVMQVTLSNGRSFRATANHPIWVEGQGWTRVDELRHGAVLFTPCRLNTPTSTGASSSADQKASGCRAGCISGPTKQTGKRALRTCTVKSGRRTTAPSSVAGTSITRMATASTTRSRTWKRCPPENTNSCTESSRPNGALPGRSIWTASGISRRHGIAPQKDSRGTARTAEKRSRNAPCGTSNASNAVSRFGRSRQDRGFAISTARPRGVERVGEITSSASALTAASRSCPTATVRPSTALVSVVLVRGAGTANVHDLTVQDGAEFFAEGVLVHNCRYFLHTRFGRGIVRRTRPVYMSAAWYRDQHRKGKESGSSWGLR